MIIRKSLGKGFWRVFITPKDIAKELVKENKRVGSASGSAERLAFQAIRKKYPKMELVSIS